VRLNKDGEQKFYKLYGHFSLVVLLFVATGVYAQSFSEFQRQQIAAYTKYKDAQDAKFAGYLKEQWRGYKKFVSEGLYQKPKPKKVPKATPKQIEKKGPKIYISVKKLPQKFISSPEVSKEPQEKKSTLQPKEEPKQLNQQQETVVTQPKDNIKQVGVIQKDIVFDFYGVKVGFDVPKSIKKAKFYPSNQKGIANYFSIVASSEYHTLLNDIKHTKEKLALNDWGLYLLVEDLAKHIYHYNDEAKLFEWFVFNKLGYKVKVGLTNHRVITMFYSKKVIYSTPNFRFNKKRYYVISHYNKGNIGSVYSYKQDYPGATKAFDLALKELPKLGKDYKTKMVHFTYQGKSYDVSYQYNKNLIDFLATYPQAEYKSFFNAAVDEVTYATLATSLREYINGKRASEAMNFVLAFVQKAFAYQTDQEQFGREKVMFVEETLHYKASDCEDRAILYAFLVRKLFHTPILGIKYPNHMATALYVPLDGDKVKIRGKEFVVADPTYINASIGEAMPQFKGELPKDYILVTIQ